MKLNGISTVYLMHSIEAFSKSLVSIFLPIYLLTVGHSLATVFVYLIVVHITLAFGSLAAVYTSNKIGLHNTLKIRFLFLIAVLVLLLIIFNRNDFYLVMLLAVTKGLELAFYWMPVNIIFTRSASSRTMGSSVGKFMAFPQLVAIAGPVVGGLIALKFGFPFLFFVSFAVAVVAIIPLPYTVSEKTNFDFSFQRAKLLYRKNKGYFFGEMIDSLGGDALGNIWPIFIYIGLSSIAVTGLVGTLIALGGATFTLLMGHRVDKSEKMGVFKLGAGLVSVSWVFVYFFQATAVLYVFSLAVPFFMAMFLVPYKSFFFKSAKREDAQFLVLLELPSVFGKILIYSIALVATQFTGRFEIIFLVVAGVFLYFQFFSPKDLTSKSNSV